VTDAEFRADLRRFLEEHHLGPPPKDGPGRREWQRRWCALLADAGRAGPSWPRRYGGMELPFARQVIYAEELARARVPGHPGTGVIIAGPTIITHGTDDQRDRWLRPLLRADVTWAQAFSEPDAGSDLASLTTKAVRDGDHYVITGRKVWSSWAEHADGLFTLVRTGRGPDRHDGITYLVVDARDPGVTVRPIVDLTGRSEFCEITFDEVLVPVADRIGEEGGGWAIARTSLGHERSAGALTQARFYRRVADDLLALARKQGAAALPVTRQRLARLETDVRLLGYCGARTVAEIIARGEPGPVSSFSRLFNSQVEQRLHELAVDLLGADGLLGPEVPDTGRWAWGFLRTRASTIGAGTSEIQRTIIGEKVLGLPREPGL
jgi:alkylation response protein AidB-like acyl-CoA dehydrogenase